MESRNHSIKRGEIPKSLMSRKPNLNLLMAHLNVLIDEQNDLFTIEMDRMSDLTVNGVDYYNGPFNQTQPGVIEFSMQGTSLDIVHPDQTMYLKSSDGTKTYVLWLGYYSGSGYQNIYGMAKTVNEVLREATDGPILFSQGNLTGSFQSK